MRRLTLPLAVLLASCAAGSSAVTRQFDLQIALEEPAKQQELTEAAVRVIDRRLGRLGEKVVSHTVNNRRLTIEASNEAAMDTVTAELQEPFSMEFMREAKPGEKADAEVMGHGSFVKTGVTYMDIAWNTAQTQDNGQARILLDFTAEGLGKMKAVFAQNPDKFLGMFIRGKLVSKLLVDSATLKEQIVISDIPSREIADAFSDDVNVGRYVTFTPLP